MIKALFIIIGVILLVWFLLPYFPHRILNIGNMTGIAVGFVLLLYGIFFHPVNRFIARLWQHGAGKVIEIIIGVCILAILVLAVLTMVCMGRGMQAAPPSGGQKTVIVLGCKVRGTSPSLMLVERLQAAYDYLCEHPESRAIVSGGQGEDEDIPEASAMYDWLVANGIAPERILQEDRSTDTHENLAYSMELIDAMDSDYWTRDVVLVTNEFHEYRALKIAKAAGFEAAACPAKTVWWLFPTFYVREMYGILEDWFLKT